MLAGHLASGLLDTRHEEQVLHGAPSAAHTGLGYACASHLQHWLSSGLLAAAAMAGQAATRGRGAACL